MAVPALSEPYRPGVIIAGKYRLAERLGAGAMGTVWSAANLNTLGRVALKLIERPEAELRCRLLREARACASVQHKNVVQVFDMGQTGSGDPFLVLELLRGETLAALLSRRRRLGEVEAAAVARDAARGLSAVHAQGVVHRDLKPANIFLHEQPGEDAPIVKLLDFGVSKSLTVSDGLHTTAGCAIGSPVYMSPEQACGQPDVDLRADLWSLGVVLYEMLTGERPFTGETPEVLFKIAHTVAARVSRRVRRVAPELDELVAACLTRDRAQRPASAAEIAARLDVFVGSAGTRGSLPSLPGDGPVTALEASGGEARSPVPGATVSGTRPRSSAERSEPPDPLNAVTVRGSLTPVPPDRGPEVPAPAAESRFAPPPAGAPAPPVFGIPIVDNSASVAPAAPPVFGIPIVDGPGSAPPVAPVPGAFGVAAASTAPSGAQRRLRRGILLGLCLVVLLSAALAVALFLVLRDRSRRPVKLDEVPPAGSGAPDGVSGGRSSPAVERAPLSVHTTPSRAAAPGAGERSSGSAGSPPQPAPKKKKCDSKFPIGDCARPRFGDGRY